MSSENHERGRTYYPGCELPPSDLLRQTGWSHAELARRLEIPPSTVLSWVRSGYWPEPVMEYLRKMAEAVEKILPPVRQIPRSKIDKEASDGKI